MIFVYCSLIVLFASIIGVSVVVFGELSKLERNQIRVRKALGFFDWMNIDSFNVLAEMENLQKEVASIRLDLSSRILHIEANSIKNISNLVKDHGLTRELIAFNIVESIDESGIKKLNVNDELQLIEHNLGNKIDAILKYLGARMCITYNSPIEIFVKKIPENKAKKGANK